MKFYILAADGRTPVEVDVLTWGEWFSTADRTLQRTDIRGGIVSTVFLGLDHNWSLRGAPVLWETMVFADGVDDVASERYRSYEDAAAGHAAMVDRFGGAV